MAWLLAYFSFNLLLFIIVWALLKNYKTAALISTSGFICLLTLEFGLRKLTDNYKTYSERNGAAYVSPYDHDLKSHYYRLYEGEFVDRRKEFAYKVTVNKLGLVDGHKLPSTKDSTYRILCLGDSFTQGEGAPEDSSWSVLLESKLNRVFPDSFTVYNAGICGSDIIFMSKLYELIDTQYRPHEVVYFLNTTDLYEISIRGGDERFGKNGTVHYRKAPWYEPVFEHSFIFRFICLDIMNFTMNLTSKEQREEEKKRSCQVIKRKIQSLRGMRGVKTTFIFHPMYQELKYNSYPDNCLNELFELQGVLNLMAIGNPTQTYDLKVMESYSWPINEHFNGKGYNWVAEQIATLYLPRSEE